MLFMNNKYIYSYDQCKYHIFGLPDGSVLKNPPVNAGDLVGSVSLEDPLEKEMATHSSILAGRIPWTEEPGGLPSVGSHRVGHG